METVLLTCRSLTYAQRASRALSAAGIRNIIVRTPQNLSREGCGYALRVSADRMAEALETLERAGLPPKRVYRMLRGGGYEEVVR